MRIADFVDLIEISLLLWDIIYSPYLLMEIELGDSKGTYRWGMLPGMGTPSTRGIGYRTSVDI